MLSGIVNVDTSEASEIFARLEELRARRHAVLCRIAGTG